MSEPLDTHGDSIRIDYVLYTHFAIESDDCKHINHIKETAPHQLDNNGAPTNLGDLPSVKTLAAHLPELWKLLSDSELPGILILFYGYGYADLLEKAQHRGWSDPDLVRKLAFVGKLKEQVFATLANCPDAHRRIRFVTANDFINDVEDSPGMIRMLREHTDIGPDVVSYLMGDSRQLRYDAPKIPEAVVRLRMLGTNVPVFRLDWDVVFGAPPRAEKTKVPPCLGLQKPIQGAVEGYTIRRQDSREESFIFSGSYDFREALEGSKNFDDWKDAFATRVLPSLKVYGKKFPEHWEKPDTSWDDYARHCFDLDLTQHYYKSLERLGAHPKAAVISGAMLCLSPTVILDFTPFSNFRLNVMWIDDHLKFALFRELGQISRYPTKNGPKAKHDDVVVRKNRMPTTNLPAYLFESYLPTLLWGMIMDAWISEQPLAKRRPEDIDPEEYPKWCDIRAGKYPGPLPKYMRAAVQEGTLVRGAESALRSELSEAAMRRMKEVHDEWSDLHGTFAEVWATGQFPSVFGGQNFVGLYNGAKVSPSILRDLETLIDDAVAYIKWALIWPKFVQTVRTYKQGTIQTDLAWPLPVDSNPPHEG